MTVFLVVLGWSILESSPIFGIGSKRQSNGFQSWTQGRVVTHVRHVSKAELVPAGVNLCLSTSLFTRGIATFGALERNSIIRHVACAQVPARMLQDGILI